MKLNNTEFQALKAEWYSKLKKTGFKDCEQPDGKLVNQHFVGGSMMKYSRAQYEEFVDFFSVLSLSAWQNTEIKEPYNVILQDYARTGNLSQACRDNNNIRSYSHVRRYIRDRLPTMITFYNETKND